jgi:hypothetical protein
LFFPELVIDLDWVSGSDSCE